MARVRVFILVGLKDEFAALESLDSQSVHSVVVEMHLEHLAHGHHHECTRQKTRF